MRLHHTAMAALRVAGATFPADAALAQTAPPADAPAGAYTMDSRRATVIFRYRRQGLSLYTARFNQD